MAKSIVELEKVKSVYGGHIFTVQANEELQNGFVGHLGKLIDKEREVYELVKPTSESIKTTPLVLIADVELNYSQQTKGEAALENFYIPAGTLCRAYEINREDIIGISVDGFANILDKKNGLKEGHYLVPKANTYQLEEVEEEPKDSAFVAEIIGKTLIGTTIAVGIQGSRVNQVYSFRVKKNH